MSRLVANVNITVSLTLEVGRYDANMRLSDVRAQALTAARNQLEAGIKARGWKMGPFDTMRVGAVIVDEEVPPACPTE